MDVARLFGPIWWAFCDHYPILIATFFVWESILVFLPLAVALVVFFFVSSAMIAEGSGTNSGGCLAMLAAGSLATIGAVRAVFYLLMRKR